MRKVFHFDSPREKYHCDASVVGCFDNRFDTVGRKLLKRIGIVQPDPIKIAGGAKALASPDQEFHRTFVLDQIQKSIRLHGTGRAILVLHSDCGAYGWARRPLSRRHGSRSQALPRRVEVRYQFLEERASWSQGGMLHPEFRRRLGCGGELAS